MHDGDFEGRREAQSSLERTDRKSVYFDYVMYSLWYITLDFKSAVGQEEIVGFISCLYPQNDCKPSSISLESCFLTIVLHER